MDIVISKKKEWVEKILCGKKPYEFFTSLPKGLTQGDRLFLYESKCSGGAGAVVGETRVAEIKQLFDKDGKLPIFGAYNFIEYFLEHVRHDLETANRFRSVKEEFDGKFERYKFGFIIRYALCDLELQHIRKYGYPIDTFKQYSRITPELQQILKEQQACNQLIKECDAWLYSIGFYDNDKSNYRYAVLLDDVQKYQQNKELSLFRGKTGDVLDDAPKPWCYASRAF